MPCINAKQRFHCYKLKYDFFFNFQLLIFNFQLLIFNWKLKKKEKSKKG